ncbi:MAG TPA: BatD family protein, partial [bacterium]|nr:BatD family protein [bacterium]
TVSPAELRGNIYLPRGRRPGQDPFFEGFFPDPFNYERRPFVLRSDPVSIRVLPLPGGAPASFTGGVGNFDLEVEVAPRRVKVGEPFTITVSVRGIGNLGSVGMPAIDLGEGFRTYEPEIETKPEVVGGRIGGTKIFRTAVVPLEDGDLQLPDVVLSFFDPVRKSYEEARAACGAVSAAPAPEGERARLVSAPAGPSNREIELLGKDILYIKTEPGEWTRPGESGRFGPVFWLLQSLPAVVVILAWRVGARRERLRSDKVYARKVGASRSARRRFDRARRLLEAGESREFYAEAHRAFARYLGDRLGIPSAAVDAAGVRARLEGLKLPPGTLDHLRECFETCDRVRYAPGGGDRAEMERFLAMAQELVARMEKIKL